MRFVGLDIHRIFAGAVMLDEGKVVRLGRVGMMREHLEAFARTLTHDDHVVVEATGNTTAVVEVLAPHVGCVVIANLRQVRLVAGACIKTDVIDATVLAPSLDVTPQQCLESATIRRVPGAHRARRSPRPCGGH